MRDDDVGRDAAGAGIGAGVVPHAPPEAAQQAVRPRRQLEVHALAVALSAGQGVESGDDRGPALATVATARAASRA